MSKITIDNDDDQLAKAIVNAKNGDIIELLPGEYFSNASPFICTVRRNITLIGKTSDKDAVKIYSSFTIDANTIMIFKNLTIQYTANSDNTLAAFDGAEIYGDNIRIDRLTRDNWDTIYGKNAFYSFKDSQISTGYKTAKTIGMSLENCQIFTDNTKIHLLFLKNSRAYLRDSKITHRLELRQHSQLFFNNLLVDSKNIDPKYDVSIRSSSQMSGQNLYFLSTPAQIRILKSNLTVDNLQPDLKQLHFQYDDTSKVNVNGNHPYNEDSSNINRK